MALDEADVIPFITDQIGPMFKAEERHLNRIDRWARWSHDKPHTPKHATKEYQDLIARAQSPWGDLIVRTIAQTLYVAGYRRATDDDNRTAWAIWQANGMDARQIALHRAALTYGLAYELVLPGKTMTGEPMPMMRGLSPRQMIAIYEDPAIDDWPAYAMRVIPKKGSKVKIELLDDELVHTLEGDSGPCGALTYQGQMAHTAGVCPVVRFANRFDLEGRAAGEVEPYISVLGRLDQTTFDRLVVQRFASWVVRTIAGMDIPKSADAAGKSTAQVKQELKVEDMLVAVDKDTKFGSLPASPLAGFNESHDVDARVLSAVSQTPAHELLGTMANLSAEALAAARASQTAKSDELKMTFGEDHGRGLRLGAHYYGDTEAAADFEAQIRWRDTSIRSLSQAADALGKLTTMLGFPAELLWEKIPGIDALDVERAKAIIEKGGGIEAALRSLIDGQTSLLEVA